MPNGLSLRARGLILLGVVCGHALLLLLPGPDFAKWPAPSTLQVQIVARTVSASGVQPISIPAQENQVAKTHERVARKKIAAQLHDMSVSASIPSQPVVHGEPAEPVPSGEGGLRREENAAHPEDAGVARQSAGPSAVPSVRVPASCDTRLRQEDYPASARRDEIEGRVVVHARVMRSGRVEEVKVARRSGHAVLDEAALRAVRHWRCSPASQDGMAVDSWVAVPVVFRLDD